MIVDVCSSGLKAAETPRCVSFCAHAIHNPNEVFVVEGKISSVWLYNLTSCVSLRDTCAVLGTSIQ